MNSIKKSIDNKNGVTSIDVVDLLVPAVARTTHDASSVEQKWNALAISYKLLCSLKLQHDIK